VAASDPTGVDEMKSLFRQPARLGLIILLAVAAVAAAPGAASAQVISGTATGKTIAQGNGTFRIVGTFTDASTGEVGTYVGTYVETTTGYISCRFIGLGAINCDEPADFTCNLIEGEVTFRSHGRRLTLGIGTDFNFGRISSAVCLDPTNPEIHNVTLELFGTESRGYGDPSFVWGSMGGTSTPLAGGVYADTFFLRIFTD
jgi:hypothetical protein